MSEESRVVALKKTVVAMLNAATLSQPLNAVRQYVPKFTLPDLNTLALSVLWTHEDQEIASRTEWDDTVTLDVGVAKKIDADQTDPSEPTKLSEIDDLVLLCEQIQKLFPAGRFAGTTWSVTKRPRTVPYDQKRLQTEHTFFSIISVEFKQTE